MVYVCDERIRTEQQLTGERVELCVCDERIRTEQQLTGERVEWCMCVMRGSEQSSS